KLQTSFPEGFILRGCSEDFANLLKSRKGEAFLLGKSATINLSTFQPKKSLQILAQRGIRESYIQELPVSNSSRKIIEKLWTQSKYFRVPRLRYLFQDPGALSQRIFCLASNEPLAAVCISRLAEESWHLEVLIRDKRAPVGSMESLILWVCNKLYVEGFATFSLGEVPFLPDNSIKGRSSSLFELSISAAARAVLKGRFNIQGLYSFKDKFTPHWEPVFWCGWPKISLIDLAWIGLHSKAI
ncbi:MAG: DUF2156 domain-containing protein, partial [Bdellovibrionales bacterium]|nr:DUF2156 domain-containing protein [Bdellovibrionales bacterium]